MTSRPPAAGTGTGARTETMRKGRQADSARRRQRVLAALDRATASGTEISASGIARAAGVDRTFLYRHRDLLEKIHAAEAAPPPAGETAGPPSPAHPCKLTCSQPTNAPSGSPAASASSNSDCPMRSANRHGVNPGSAHPPTSTRSTRKSPTLNSKPPTCACNSKNATTNSQPREPRTAS
jgi:hypothetical protein